MYTSKIKSDHSVLNNGMRARLLQRTAISAGLSMWQEWQIPRASGLRGASGNRKIGQGFEYPKMFFMGPCVQKLDYELGKPVVEVPHESSDCIELRM